MLVLATATALALTPAIVDAPHSFTSCAAAVAYAKQAPEVGQLTYQIRYGYSRAPQFSRNGKVLFRAHVAIVNPVITLPQWTWANATAAQAKNFAEFQANVLRHEQGHWALARDYVKKRDTTEWLPESMTREQAAAHFKVYFDTIAAGLQNAQDFYDGVTDHGRNQQRAAMFGLGGGDGTMLGCGSAMAETTPTIYDQVREGKIVIFAGAKASSAVTGPMIAGLALSLTTRPLKKEWPGHLWLSLELRNMSGRVRWFKGLGELTSLQLDASDENGHVLPLNKYSTIHLDPGPVTVEGSPIGPGDAAYLRVSVDNFVALPKSGQITVIVRTIRVIDAESGEVLNLVSNSLTIKL